jgi:hypothetical protein
MSTLSLLGPNAVAFINRLASNNQGKTPLVSIALAKAISSTLFLPTSPVEVIDQHYRTVCSITAAQQVSAINELVIIDTTAVLHYIHCFYVARYFTAYPPDTLWCLNPDTVMQDFFGISQGVDETLLTVIKENPLKLTQYHNSAMALVKELQSKQGTPV